VCCDLWRGSARRCVLLIQNYIFSGERVLLKTSCDCSCFEEKKLKPFISVVRIIIKRVRRGDASIHFLGQRLCCMFKVLRSSVTVSSAYSQNIYSRRAVVPPMGFLGGFLCVACTKIKRQRLFLFSVVAIFKLKLLRFFKTSSKQTYFSSSFLQVDFFANK